MASNTFVVQGSRPGSASKPTNRTKGYQMGTRNRPLTTAQRQANEALVRRRAEAARRGAQTRAANARRARRGR